MNFKCSLFLWQVVAGLRKKLDLNPVDGLDGNCQVLVLSALHSGALSSKKLADIWLKAMSSTCSPSELGPLDVVILLLLHSFIPGLKKQIQNVLRNRIKAGIISEALIEKTFTVFLAVCICMCVRNSWKSVSLSMWQCQWASSYSHFEGLWYLHLQGLAVQEEPWKLRHHDPSFYLEMLTQGHSFHPRRLQFVALSLWVPQILQHVNCLCDTLLIGSEDWHYYVTFD